MNKNFNPERRIEEVYGQDESANISDEEKRAYQEVVQARMRELFQNGKSISEQLNEEHMRTSNEEPNNSLSEEDLLEIRKRKIAKDIEAAYGNKNAGLVRSLKKEFYTTQIALLDLKIGNESDDKVSIQLKIDKISSQLNIASMDGNEDLKGELEAERRKLVEIKLDMDGRKQVKELSSDKDKEAVQENLYSDYEIGYSAVTNGNTSIKKYIKPYFDHGKVEKSGIKFPEDIRNPEYDTILHVEKDEVSGNQSTYIQGPLLDEESVVGSYNRRNELVDGAHYVEENLVLLQDDKEVAISHNTATTDQSFTHTNTVDGKKTFEIFRTQNGSSITQYDRQGNVLMVYYYDKDGQPLNKIPHFENGVETEVTVGHPGFPSLPKEFNGYDKENDQWDDTYLGNLYSAGIDKKYVDIKETAQYPQKETIEREFQDQEMRKQKLEEKEKGKIDETPIH